MTIASVDPFLTRRRRKGYDCRDFLRDVWEAETGEDLSGRNVRSFRRIAEPVSPCIVRFRNRHEAHVGMFLRCKVLHLAEASPRYERIDLAMVGFGAVRFYL